jgi:hypothetical protein
MLHNPRNTIKAALKLDMVYGSDISNDEEINKILDDFVEGDKKKKCFIVTAVMGDVDNPSVVVMSKFRDRVLNQSSIGKRYINYYYEYSPSVANFIGEHKFIKQIVYFLIIKPLVLIVTIVMGD